MRSAQAPMFTEETADIDSGCWAQCGRTIEKGDPRVRFDGRYLFHPSCWRWWSARKSNTHLASCEASPKA